MSPNRPTTELRMLLTWLLPVLACVILFTGCAGMKSREFQSGRPLFEPERFFTGQTRSTGVVENRRGKPMQRVTTKTVGRWAGDSLRIEQDLVFGGTRRSHRSWSIRRIDSHRYEATANDIIGIARGTAYGDVFHWKFTLATKPGNPLFNIVMSQWMYLQPDGRTMINHTTVTKAGIVLAQVTEQFRKEKPLSYK